MSGFASSANITDPTAAATCPALSRSAVSVTCDDVVVPARAYFTSAIIIVSVTTIHRHCWNTPSPERAKVYCPMERGYRGTTRNLV